MNKVGIRMAVTAVACSAMSLAACWAEEPKSSSDAKAPASAVATVATPETSKPSAAPAAPLEVAAASPSSAAPEAPAAAPAAEKPAAVAQAAPAAAPAVAAATGPVADLAKTEGVTFKEGRYRNAADEPVPVVTKDYTVDWATWQGFRRYHDACHVCHGPNALGSTFAPALAESLKTMDYATFYGIVVGGQQREAGGTKYIMPAFGEDKNIMCYLDDIYTYVKARSLNADGKGGMPPGRPNGREDISEYAKKAALECNP